MTIRAAKLRARRLSAWGVSGAVLSLALVAGLWAWGPRLAAFSAMMPGNEPEEPLSAGRAETLARRAEAVFADAQAVWARVFRDELGQGYAPAEVRVFVGRTQSPCAGAAEAAGPFYCAITRSAALDLATLDLVNRLQRQDGDLGIALLVARVAAAHVQVEIAGGAPADGAASAGARALQGDCLAGVWAHHAAPRVGAVEPGFYGRLIGGARRVAGAQGRGGAVQPDPALFAPGREAAREAAFAVGLAAGTIAACL